jgi:ferredoxin
MTYDQAAGQLNWSVATVKSRLAKGRLRLRWRLARRGFASVAAGMASAVSDEARAAVPQKLVQSTIRAANSCPAGAFPAAVTELTEGVL